MRIQQFLEHHHLVRNPFSEEDAQTDLVFKNHCIESTFHPSWDKVYGDPTEPATAVVFGEKGAGKTAMRLQIARHLEQYNAQHPGKRVFVIHYDDFNPFLDRFQERFSGRRRRPDKVLAQWKLWDHMDAILSLGVTGMIDEILDANPRSPHVPCHFDPAQVDSLSRHQARDLLLLAACYDQSTAETFGGRWHRLRKRLKFSIWKSYASLALGIAVSVPSIFMLFYILFMQWDPEKRFGPTLQAFAFGGLMAVIVAAWLPWLWKFWNQFRTSRAILRHVRVGNHEPGPLRRILMRFRASELAGQPLPNKESTDDRYELMTKFQSVLKSLGYSGVVVLVDRLDEPHLINGSAELMKLLLWPMLDNKFLKHADLGMKLMLPIELTRFIDREEKDFYEKARLDKQNMIASFQWTGEALYDVTNARIRACADTADAASLDQWFDGSVSEQRLRDAMRSLRTPRHLFKFMYRLLVAHCNAHLDHQPVWQISSDVFEPTLAVYQREQDAFDRGLGAG